MDAVVRDQGKGAKELLYARRGILEQAQTLLLKIQGSDRNSRAVIDNLDFKLRRMALENASPLRKLKARALTYLGEMPEEDLMRLYLRGLHTTIRVYSILGKRTGHDLLADDGQIQEAISGYTLEFFSSLKSSKRAGIAPKLALDLTTKLHVKDPFFVLSLVRENSENMTSNSIARQILSSPRLSGQRVKLLSHRLKGLIEKNPDLMRPTLHYLLSKNLDRVEEAIEETRSRIERYRILHPRVPLRTTEFIVTHHKNPDYEMRQLSNTYKDHSLVEETQIKEIQSQLSGLNEKPERAKSELADYQKVPESISPEIQKGRKELASINAEKDRIQKTIGELRRAAREEFERVNKAIVDATERRIRSIQELQDLGLRKKAIEAEITSLAKLKTELSERTAAMEKRLAALGDLATRSTRTTAIPASGKREDGERPPITRLKRDAVKPISPPIEEKDEGSGTPQKPPQTKRELAERINELKRKYENAEYEMLQFMALKGISGLNDGWALLGDTVNTLYREFPHMKREALQDGLLADPIGYENTLRRRYYG